MGLPNERREVIETPLVFFFFLFFCYRRQILQFARKKGPKPRRHRLIVIFQRFLPNRITK